MKMRKIIALFATLSIAASFCVTASAAVTTTAPEIVAVAEKLDNDTFVEYYEEDIPEGKEAWTVTFEIANITDSLNYTKTGGSNAKPKLSGKALDAMEIILKTTDTEAFEAIDEDYSYVIDHALATDLIEGFTTDGWTSTYSGNFVYPAAKDTEGIVDGSTEGYMTMCFLINAGDVINFTVSEATISIFEYTDSNISGQTNFTTDKGNLSVPEVITVGTAATEPDPEPADPNRTAITSSFTATSTTYVEVELVGKATNSYALPSGVKNGEAIVAGILKYTVDVAGTNGVAPVSGDIFNVYVKNLGSEVVKTILTEKVQ